MNARDKRALTRVSHAASELGTSGSPVRVMLRDAPPAFELFAAKLQTSVATLHLLAREERTLTPQQAGEGRETASVRKRLRRDYMIPLTRIGKPLFRFGAGVEKTLKVPHARASHRELVTSAEVMLQAVRPHRALLVSAGLPKTFITEFRDLTRDLKRIATTSSARQAKFARVSKRLREELATASETLSILDGLVLARADRDAALARTWKNTVRTPKRLGRPRASARKLALNDAPVGTITAPGHVSRRS
jgi:hypothetical protein